MLAGVMLLALASTCPLVAQTIEVEASAHGVVITCASTGTMDETGSLLSADSDTFDLDLCTPTQDCSAPKRAHFRIHLVGGPPLNEVLDHASFVRVQLESTPTAGICRERIAISGLAKWLGDRSPTKRPDEFYFAAIRNWSAPATGWPFIAQPCPGNVRDTVSIRAPRVSGDFHPGPPRKQVLNDGAEWTLALQKPGSCSVGAGGWSYWVSRKAER